MSASEDLGGDLVECPPGAGGYQLIVYKDNALKKASPMSKEGYQYIKSKYKKHCKSNDNKNTIASSSSSSSRVGVQDVYKEIKKKPRQRKPKQTSVAVSTSSTTVAVESGSGVVAGGGGEKPKRKLSPTQLENLKRGREKRAANLAAAAAVAASTSAQ